MAVRPRGWSNLGVRILIATRGSTGHVLPLAPLGHAALRAGHEVLVAAQRRHGGNVQRAGLPLAPLGDPPDAECKPPLAEFGRLGVEARSSASPWVSRRWRTPPSTWRPRRWTPRPACTVVGVLEGLASRALVRG